MEIEIRAKVEDPNKIKDTLSQLGAKLVKNVRQTDRYYGAICLYKKLNYTFLLRVRYQGNKAFLTYKGAKQKKPGIWEEYELPLSQPAEMEKMLKEMGMDLVVEVNKHRLEYTLDEFTICLDSIKGLGTFIEVELQASDRIPSKQVKTKLQKFLKTLDIKEEDLIHHGYVTLLLRKHKTPYSEYIVN